MNSIVKAGLITACMMIHSAAWCSFDLILLPSATGRVGRIDPNNQVNLGSFGPNTPGHVVNSADGIWVQSSTGRYARYNYSTGELLNQSSVITNFISNPIAGLNANGLTGIVGNNIREINMSTGGATNIATLGTTNIYSRIERLNSGLYVAMGKTSSNTHLIETYSAGGLVDSIQILGAMQGSCGQIAVTPNGLGYRIYTFVGLGGGSPAPTLRSITISSTGLISSTASISVSSTGWALDSEPATVAGHDGLWVIGQSAAGTTIVNQIATTPTMAVVDSFVIDYTIPSDRPWSAVNIVAPEPSGILATALPLAALLLRRRRRCLQTM